MAVVPDTGPGSHAARAHELRGGRPVSAADTVHAVALFRQFSLVYDGVRIAVSCAVDHCGTGALTEVSYQRIADALEPTTCVLSVVRAQA
ncbi:hypothetical protein ACFYWU_42115 [Streptomyces chrestomyceticus]|uniref:hypothetical protein n=1 Tax=Streptomyces chrestomyceticus TaxID=68185 RepID=UPI0036C0A60C